MASSSGLSLFLCNILCLISDSTETIRLLALDFYDVISVIVLVVSMTLYFYDRRYFYNSSFGRRPHLGRLLHRNLDLVT